MFPGMAAAIEEARQRPDVPVAATDQDLADLADSARKLRLLPGHPFRDDEGDPAAQRVIDSSAFRQLRARVGILAGVRTVIVGWPGRAGPSQSDSAAQAT